VLKDGIYFTTEGSHGLKALSKRLAQVEVAYDAKQVRGRARLTFSPLIF
jgi:hypothetical protein